MFSLYYAITTHLNLTGSDLLRLQLIHQTFCSFNPVPIPVSMYFSTWLSISLYELGHCAPKRFKLWGARRLHMTHKTSIHNRVHPHT